MKRTFSKTQSNETPQACLVESSDFPGGMHLISPFKIAKKSSANDLVDLAMEIQKADRFVTATTCNKLQVIVQQVRYLQQKAQTILEEAEGNAQLHRVACNFVKVPGNTYHLYERPTGQDYFSMLAPEEWSSPHKFLGSFRLEADLSWTNVNDLKHKDLDMLQVQQLMESQNPLCLPALTQIVPMDI